MKLTLEKPVYGGDSLGHAEGGKAVFVPLTLPGETISARIIEEKRTFAKAELEEILTASPHRIPPACPHFGPCGGCHYQHTDYPTQLGMKQQILRETLERAGVKIPAKIETLSADPWQYRNRIRLAFTPEGRFGYRSRRSHDLIPIVECPIAAPLLFSTAERVSALLGQSPSPTQITEMELFTNEKQSQLLLTLFTESEAPASAETWLNNLAASFPSEVTSIRLQHSDGALTPRIMDFTGSASLTYEAADFPYQVDHGAFFQVNRHLIDQFVALVTEDHTGQQAWDLYAGVGLFARQLTQSFAQVLAVESAGASFEGLNQNLAGTTGQAIASTTLDFLRRNREQREPRPDLIILDPPRAGLGDQVTTLLNAIGAPQMVYVSCDPTTLARDLRALTQDRYRLDRLTQVDMFPQTFHMETVAHLHRS